MLDSQKNAVVATPIGQFAMKITNNFDKLRAKLKMLEMLLNCLGNPGCQYIDEEHFDMEYLGGRNYAWFYTLKFEAGKIKIQKKGILSYSQWWIGEEIREMGVQSAEGWEEQMSLADMSLSKIDGMLKRLPIFISNYQKFLKEKNGTLDSTLKQLTMVVEAITTVITK